MNAVSAAIDPLPDLVAAAMVVALNAYVLLGGADFGGGVWDLLAAGPRRRRQRALVADAIGPIWEANHVWLILVVVILFTAFPPAFARVTTVLHIPLALMLVGIVLRGSAFTFRSYDSLRDTVQRRWGRIFAIASTATPVLLGIVVGALASGDVRDPSAAAPNASFLDVYVRTWLSPFTVGVGVLTLTLFAFLAAVYLTLEASDDALREDFRRRALGAAAAVFIAAFADLLLAGKGAPRVWAALTAGPAAVVVHGAAAAAAIGAITALLRRRYRAARIAAAAQVSLVLWGWAVAQFPYILPPDLTITDSAAPTVTLELLLGALVLGLIVLVPSLWYLLRVFKTSPAEAVTHSDS